MITNYMDTLPVFTQQPKKKRGAFRPKIKENRVLKACLQWLEAQGCFVWRNNTGATMTASGGFIKFGLKGSADIIGLNARGIFLAIEAKASDGTQSDAQMDFQRCVEQKNGIYVLARSVDDLEARKNEIVGKV